MRLFRALCFHACQIGMKNPIMPVLCQHVTLDFAVQSLCRHDAFEATVMFVYIRPAGGGCRSSSQMS